MNQVFIPLAQYSTLRTSAYHVTAMSPGSLLLGHPDADLEHQVYLLKSQLILIGLNLMFGHKTKLDYIQVYGKVRKLVKQHINSQPNLQAKYLKI